MLARGIVSYISIYITEQPIEESIVEGSLEVKPPTIWTYEKQAGQRQREEKN
jgi:hypothetical protein